MPGFFRMIFLTVCGSLLFCGGCANNAASDPFVVEGRAWPDSPDERRIVYVGEFSNARDLSIKENVWRALISFAVGAVNDALIRPMDVATTGDGKVIFVSDPDAGCVHRFDLRSKRYHCLTAGTDAPQISPIGLAVTEQGFLFVSDSMHGTLWQAGPRDKKLSPFNVSHKLSRPTGMHWSTDLQRLYVTDTGEQVVLEFDRSGNLKRTVGKRGNGPGELNFPTYLWVDVNNELLVADSLNFRIQRYSRDAKFLHMFGEDGDQPGDFSRPKGIATDSFGNIYVIDALMHLVQVFSSEGDLLLVVGEQGQGQGQFWLPNGIFVTGDNTIFVADSYNKRIQVFRYIGPGL